VEKTVYVTGVTEEGKILVMPDAPDAE